MGATTKTLYDTDFADWAGKTAELIRAGRLEDVDLEHVAEEIADLGKSERLAVRSQLRRMLLHLIKQRIQPERDGASWRGSIADARYEIAARIENSPSLRRDLETNLENVYRRAVRDAVYETGVSGDSLPGLCPWNLDELLAGEPR